MGEALPRTMEATKPAFCPISGVPRAVHGLVVERENKLVAVIIPALNEEASLPGVLSALPEGLEVLVVDNGSTDDTAGVARRAGARLIREARRGYGRAVRAGMRALEALSLIHI